MNAAATTILSNASKLRALAVGASAGTGLAFASNALLASPSQVAKLEQQGTDAISDRELRGIVGPLGFVFAASVGTGLGRRSNNAAVTTVSLGAAMLLATPNVAAMVNADTDRADEHLRTIGLMVGTAGAGVAVGATTMVGELRAKSIGLGALGLAVGTIAPESLHWLGSLPSQLAASHRART